MKIYGKRLKKKLKNLKNVTSLSEEADQKVTELNLKKKLHKGCIQSLDFVSKSH